MATALVMVVMIVMAFYVIHCKPENADRRNATHASDNQTLRLSDATDYSDDGGDGGGGGGGGGERDANLDEFVRRALSTQSQSVESGDDDLESGTTMENPMRSPGVAAAASGSSWSMGAAQRRMVVLVVLEEGEGVLVAEKQGYKDCLASGPSATRVCIDETAFRRLLRAL